MLGLPRATRPSLVDVLLASFFAVVVLVEALTEPEVQTPWLHGVVGCSAVLAMAWRRVWPLPVAAVVVMAEAVLAINGGGLSVALAVLVMSFTVGAETEGRTSWWGLLLLLLPYIGGLSLARGGLIPGDVAASVVLVAAPWVAGRALRSRAEALAEAMARAAVLEHEKQREADEATTRERTRLARELHDVVSHSISVIAIQAQAVRRRLAPERPAEATDLAAIENAAREAMVEMRRLFGVLREQGGEPELAPQPGLGELGRLLDRVRDTGVRVDLVTDGDAVELSPGLDLAAYRIAQEAVTNALRHSGASHLTVRLGYRQSALEVTVEDNGSGFANVATRCGHGLRGIRERAELYGGSLDLGTTSGGGARVHASLPIGRSS